MSLIPSRSLHQLLQTPIQLDRHRPRGLRQGFLLLPRLLPRHHQVRPAAALRGRLDHAARCSDRGVVVALGVAQPLGRQLRRGRERPVDRLPGPGRRGLLTGGGGPESTEPLRPQHAARDHLEDRAQEEPLRELLHRVRRPVRC